MILCGAISLLAGILLVLWKNRMTPVVKKALLLLLVFSVLGLFAAFRIRQNPVLVDGFRLWRNPSGEGDYEQKLIVKAEDEEEKSEIVINVPEQKWTSEEEKAYLAAAEDEITAEFPRENESVECVREAVLLRDSYQEGRVEAEWKFEPENVVDTKGNVTAVSIPEEGILAEAVVTLACGESQEYYSFPFRVYAPVLDAQEKFLKELQGIVAKEGKKEGEEYLSLPQRVAGTNVTFLTEKNYLPEKMVLFGIVIALLLPAAEQSRKREEKKKRERELLLEYPDMVSKLALLLGAGMSLSGAWERIVSSYLSGRKTGKKKCLPIYEEMKITLYEIQSGAGEIKAYQHFGEHCGLQRYHRFSNMLVQNLKKGNRKLMDTLLQEADASFEERKSLAKKLGEEAGTKMLFPMLVLLVMMMALILFPAFLFF